MFYLVFSSKREAAKGVIYYNCRKCTQTGSVNYVHTLWNDVARFVLHAMSCRTWKEVSKFCDLGPLLCTPLLHGLENRDLFCPSIGSASTLYCNRCGQVAYKLFQDACRKTVAAEQFFWACSRPMHVVDFLLSIAIITIMYDFRCPYYFTALVKSVCAWNYYRQSCIC